MEPRAADPFTADELFDEAPCGLLLLADNGRICRVNASFCRWTGYTAEALTGQQRLQDLLTVGAKIFSQTHWWPLLGLQGSVAEIKIDLLHTSGAVLPMLANAIRQQRGDRVFISMSLMLVEDRNQHERELRLARQKADELLDKEKAAHSAYAEAQRRLHAAAEDRAAFAEQMMAIVSHDLRNPLSAIQLSATLLARGQLDAQQLKILERVDRSARRPTSALPTLPRLVLHR